jgi:hypothetical protein
MTIRVERRAGDEEHLLLCDPAREPVIDALERVAHDA